MKLRGAWGNAVKFVSLAALLCGIVLWTVNTGASKRGLASSNKGQAAEVSRPSKPATAQETQRWATAYGKLPMSFEENQGQSAREVRYVARGGGYELFLTPQEAVMALRPAEHLDFSPRHRSAYLRAIREQLRTGQTTQLTAIRMHLEGANPTPQISGADRLPTRVNYFTGSDPKNWHTDVPAYARVKYSGVYPGVDLVFYGNQGRLEYDFVVAPGADPRAIQLKIDGARKMRVNAHGDLVLSVPSGEVALQKPLIYQQSNGKQRQIAGNFVLAANHRVTFAIPNYDREKPLILDPILNYSTYLGGSGIENQSLPVGIALDSAGDAFVAGQTFSVDFPAGTTAGLVTNPNPDLGASYVAELNPAGTQLLYSSYLIGSTTTPTDGATSVAVDSTGKVYVTGITAAPGFPSKNPLPYSADITNGTGFITKLDPTQSGAGALLFSTYIGGTTGMDLPNGIAVDANGNAYIVGETLSTDYPVMNAYQAAFNPANVKGGVNNGWGSAFLSRVNITTSTSTLAYSTYLSGNVANASSSAPSAPGYGDNAFGVAVDTSNNAYIVGTTTSNNPTNFPSSTNANQPAPPVGNAISSAFVTKINTAASGAASLVYSTYIAGSTQELGYGIALGPNNLVYITGPTSSNDFPATTNAFDTAGAGAGKAFVTVVDTTNMTAGSPFHYSTPLGGGGGDTGYGIKADSSGNAYVVGTATSPNFPLTPGPLQSARLNANGDVFVAKLSPGGNGTADLLYSTYFGGSNGASPDQGYAIAIDSANPPNAYITGQTSSMDIPILTPLPTGGALNGTSDAYVAKLSLIPTITVSPFPSFDFGVQTVGVATAPKAFTVTNNTASTATFTSIKVTGVSPPANTDFAISTNGCSPNVGAGLNCPVNVTFTPSAPPSRESATLTITATVTEGGQNSSDVFNVNLTGAGPFPAVGLAPSPLAFGNQAISTTSAPMSVTLTNTGTSALTINSIAASGDFAETNTCPASPSTLPATTGANTCTINVTFTPTATGARAGTLTVTDNAAGSPHTVPLSGTGTNAPPDFTLSASTTAETVAQGAVGAPITITVNPLNGFNSAVALTCTGTPANSSCVLSPTSVTPPTTSKLTFTAHAMLLPVPVSRPTPPPFNLLRIVPLFVALMLIFLLRSTQRLRTRVAMVTAILFCVTLAACSGAGGPAKTAKGAYQLTITGTSGTLSHTVTPAVTITVN